MATHRVGNNLGDELEQKENATQVYLRWWPKVGQELIHLLVEALLMAKVAAGFHDLFLILELYAADLALGLDYEITHTTSVNPSCVCYRETPPPYLFHSVFSGRYILGESLIGRSGAEDGGGNTGISAVPSGTYANMKT
jgi:hypothetical protein